MSNSDEDSSLPLSKPLKTLKDVSKWVSGMDPFCVATVSLKPTQRLLLEKPKTLVCHDMQGGYREDSHNIVTIPPPCWTNAGHKHGVKVLGTFITEWNDGADHCAQILKDEASYQLFASQNLKLNLIGFLGFLTKSMHESKACSQVIWYDSVTNKGVLNWQNELNSNNSCYFDICDGIFLNYTWTDEQLSNSAVCAENNRRFDVYVGVDCFGRGCFGGGGWNTYLALQAIRRHNLSAAIFAPGWVYETRAKSEFTECQNKFWGLLKSYLYPHIMTTLPIVTSFCQGYGKELFSNGHKLDSLPWTNLSFQQLQPTNFDQIEYIGPRGGLEIKNVHYTEQAFLGGGCLKINATGDTKFKESQAILSLFECNCRMDEPSFVAVNFNMDKKGMIDLFLLIERTDEMESLLLGPCGPCINKQDVKIERQDESGSSSNADAHMLPMSEQIDFDAYGCLQKHEDIHHKVYQPLKGEALQTAQRICTGGNSIAEGWQSRYYIISEKNLPTIRGIKVVLAINSQAHLPHFDFSLLIGEIKITRMQDLMFEFPKFAHLKATDTLVKNGAKTKLLDTTLQWSIIPGSSSSNRTPASYSVFYSHADTSEKSSSEQHDRSISMKRSKETSTKKNKHRS
eukprot:gene1196-568_t